MSDRDSARQRIEQQAIQNFESRPRNTAVRKTGAISRPVHDPEPTTEWFVVIPVKGTAESKSRFGGEPAWREELAMAIALDTVEAALAAPGVAAVAVVTSEAASERFDETEAFVIVEPEAGLATAIATGLDTAAAFSEPARGIAVLLGDLPALQGAELGAALDAARSLARGTVQDAEGTGTTLITAADGQSHAPAFGAGSAAAHRSAGYVALDLPIDSGLRSDVDTLEALRSLGGRLGPHTTAVLARS